MFKEQQQSLVSGTPDFCGPHHKNTRWSRNAFVILSPAIYINQNCAVAKHHRLPEETKSRIHVATCSLKYLVRVLASTNKFIRLTRNSYVA